ncbi:hypothetical protein [Reyranella sp.]|uniref:hypothetical protein n=1 Tax=Reyranella sp. TaxID=1929291 RepID=UPI003F6EDDC0
MRESAQLQREAEAQRAGLSNTLGQLREGMTTSALSTELVGVLRDSSLSVVKSLAESARTNPGAALLIGAGLTMMLTRTTGADVMATATSALRTATTVGTDAATAAAGKVKNAAGTAADTAKSLAEQATDKVAGIATKTEKLALDTAASLTNQAMGAADAARGAAGEQVDHAKRLVEEGKETAEHLNQDASKLAADTRQAVTKLFEEQPILVAAIGTALGALFGAALPVSQAERQVLGKVGAEAIDKGRDVLETAKTAVGEQIADAHLGEKVGDMAGKLVDSMVPTSSSRSA